MYTDTIHTQKRLSKDSKFFLDEHADGRVGRIRGRLVELSNDKLVLPPALAACAISGRAVFGELPDDACALAGRARLRGGLPAAARRGRARPELGRPA
jgi:hypothetical protein